MQRIMTARRLFIFLLIITFTGIVFILRSSAQPTQAKTTIEQSVNSIDAAGITVVTTPPMQTTESGGTAGFTVVLDSLPTDTVTVTLSSSIATEGTVTSPVVPLSFTTGNWDTPQPVTVTGVDDEIDDDNVAYNIILNPASTGDTEYDNLLDIPVAVTNVDDDTAGITIVTTPPMQTTESGGTAGFTVVLDSQPTDTVTVALASSIIAEGTVTSPIVPLSFTTGNWDTPQPVTVTGVDDDVVDGDIAYNIILNPASTGDTKYNSLLDVPVAVTNIDDDIAGISVVTTPPMQTTESGGTAGFTVVLTSQPTDTVTVALSSSNIAEGLVSSPIVPLSFTTGNWDTPQPVTVIGVDDDVVDGDIAYNIVLDPASTGDTVYNSLVNVNVGVTNIDEDVIGFTITPTSGLLTSENGIPTASFDVILNTIPTADVSLALNSSDTSEGTINKSLLTFTTITWNIIQTVTISGADDFIKDGDQVYVIITGPVSTTDSDYAALNPILDIPDVSVTNSDNDTSGYTITPSTDLWTSEGGATEKVQVLLKSRPISPVLLSVSSNNIDEGIVSIKNEYIDPAFWPQSTPSEITITGIDDCYNTGDEIFKVTITATSIDPLYNGPVGAPLVVTNYDAPTIAWMEPVADEGIYFSDGFSPINLRVINLCNEPISKVRFYRWVEALGDHVIIEEDITQPYQGALVPDELESGWNQVFAFAYGPPNTIQTFSEHKRILIRKDFAFRVHLPLINKNP